MSRDMERAWLSELTEASDYADGVKQQGTKNPKIPLISAGKTVLTIPWHGILKVKGRGFFEYRVDKYEKVMSNFDGSMVHLILWPMKSSRKESYMDGYFDSQQISLKMVWHFQSSSKRGTKKFDLKDVTFNPKGAPPPAIFTPDSFKS